MYQKGLMQLLTLRKDLRSMHKYLILSGLFILVQFVFGQGISPYCAHEEFHQKLLRTSPEYRKAFLEMERDIYEYTVRRDQNGPHTDFSRIVYTIPVVIHLVVPPGTPIGQGNNLTNQQVENGLDLLNQSFSNEGPFKTNSGVDVEIRFCLARRDPAGKPTNGITRTFSNLVNEPMCSPGTDASSDAAIKSLVSWDCRQYVNIWLVTDLFNANFGCGLAGFAYFPGAPCTVDGIMQEARYWTSVGGTTVTAHEMGHYFGLDHTFNGGCVNNNCLLDGDRVCDTPPDNSASFAPCNTNSCNTDAPDLPDDNTNYMDYSSCQPVHFSQGQKTRMVATLETRRNYLISSRGCQPVGNLDVAAKDIRFQSDLCGDSLCPILVVKNEGISTITKLDIQFLLDGNLVLNNNWSGSFAAGQSQNISFNCLSVPNGMHTVTFLLSNPNNGTDFDSSNDSISIQVEVTRPLKLIGIDVTPSHCISDGTAGIRVEGGKPPYRYLISNKTYIQTDSLFQLLVPGNYNVTITDEKNCTLISSFEIPDSCKSTKNKKFVLNQDATYLGNDCYLLTEEKNYETGSVWYEDKIDLTRPFDIYFQLNLGCIDGAGADGIAFVLQPISTSIGVSGGGLGYQGIRPSLAIEFDTWENGNYSDPVYDHMSLMRNGNVSHASPDQLAGPVGIFPNLANAEDCRFHNCRVKWTPQSNLFQIYVDCQLRLEYRGDIIETIFRSDPLVYFGFTAATGGAINVQQFCLDYVSEIAVLDDYIICKGESIQVSVPSKFATYSWKPSNGINNPTTFNPIITPDSTTTYFVELGDRCNMKVYDTFSITVLDPELNVSLSLEDSCNAKSATILSIHTGAADSITLYSRDGINFTKDTIFKYNPSSLITIYSKVGQCIKPYVQKLPPAIPALKDSVLMVRARSCKDSGRIVIIGVGGIPPYQYELNNNGNWLSQGIFDPLDPGSYTINIRDQRNCMVSRQLIIGDYQHVITLTIDSAQLDKSCCHPTPFVNLLATGSYPLYYYSLDGDRWTGDGLFSGLSIGLHQANARDEFGCVSDTLTFEIIDLTQVQNDTQKVNICEGASHQVGNNVYTKSGRYKDVFSNRYCCDSIIHTDLQVLPVYIFSNNKQICEGAFVQVGNKQYTATGIYTDTLSTVSGCDSIINTSLIVRPVFDQVNNQIICAGESIQVGNKFYGNTGNYLDTLESIFNCDSIIRTSLQVNPVYDMNFQPVICDRQSVQVGNKIYANAGSYLDTLQTFNGCDSIIRTSLTVHPIFALQNPRMICEGQFIQVGSKKYDQAGVFVDTLNTINGCDSVINTRLIVDQVTAALTVDSIRCYDEQFGGASARAIRGIPEFLFSFDDGRNFGKLNSVSNLPPGDYKVLIKDSLNCIDTQYFSLIVPIELETELENKIDITLGDKIILKPLLNFNPVTILWSPSDGLSCSDCLNPEVNILRSKNYTLTVTDRLGCTSTAIVQIRVDNNTQIWVPNVFSPNGDQQNDFVTVFGNHSIKQVDEFRIYDRWGNLVFLSGNFMVNDLQAGWDGNFKGEPVNPGVFVYYVKATRIDGTTVTLSGDVSVVR